MKKLFLLMTLACLNLSPASASEYFKPGLYWGVDRETNSRCWLKLRGSYPYLVAFSSYSEKAFTPFEYGMNLDESWDSGRSVQDERVLEYPFEKLGDQRGLVISFLYEKVMRYYPFAGKGDFKTGSKTCGELQLSQR